QYDTSRRSTITSHQLPRTLVTLPRATLMVSRRPDLPRTGLRRRAAGVTPCPDHPVLHPSRNSPTDCPWQDRTDTRLRRAQDRAASREESNHRAYSCVIYITCG